MQLNLDIDDDYKDYTDILNQVTAAAADYFNIPSNVELELAFVNTGQIRILNSEKRNIDKPTDVLSFPYINLNCKEIKVSDYKEDINPETNNLMLGEIIICADIAKIQAQELNHSLRREICYLYLHGLLHLLGFDHINKKDKPIMRTHEENILSALNITR